MAVIPVAASAKITIGGGCTPKTIYVKGHLIDLGDGWFTIECDGTGSINCIIDLYSSPCETPVQEYDGYAGEDANYYYFNVIQTTMTDYRNNESGTIVMSWNKAQLDAALEDYCESQ